MKIKEFIYTLEQMAPPALQESYDNAGLLIGNPEWPCRDILLCLDSTEAVIEEAMRQGCNMVIAHHPIVFSGLKKITGHTYVERTLLKAIRNDIAIYAIHTNLDNMRRGVNDRIARQLGLQNCHLLMPKKNLLKFYTYVPETAAEKVRQAIFDAGGGVISNYSECSFSTTGYGTFKGNEESRPYLGQPGLRSEEKEIKLEVILPDYLENRVLEATQAAHPYEEVAYEFISLTNLNPSEGSGLIGELEEEIAPVELLERIKVQMNTPCIRHTTLPANKIKKVAVCGGSGSFLLEAAIKAGAHIFISADYKYHQFFDADGRIIIADIGHFESEQYTIDLLKDKISEKFPTFAVRLTSIRTNPINYFI